VDGRVVSSDVVRGDLQIAMHHVTRHKTPIFNILSTAPELSISRQSLGTLPEDGNVMSKYVGYHLHVSTLHCHPQGAFLVPYIINKLNE
jgi:hypothetical protein